MSVAFGKVALFMSSTAANRATIGILCNEVRDILSANTAQITEQLNGKTPAGYILMYDQSLLWVPCGTFYWWFAPPETKFTHRRVTPGLTPPLTLLTVMINPLDASMCTQTTKFKHLSKPVHWLWRSVSFLLGSLNATHLRTGLPTREECSPEMKGVSTDIQYSQSPA